MTDSLLFWTVTGNKQDYLPLIFLEAAPDPAVVGRYLDRGTLIVAFCGSEPACVAVIVPVFPDPCERKSPRDRGTVPVPWHRVGHDPASCSNVPGKVRRHPYRHRQTRRRLQREDRVFSVPYPEELFCCEVSRANLWRGFSLHGHNLPAIADLTGSRQQPARHHPAVARAIAARYPQFPARSVRGMGRERQYRLFSAGTQSFPLVIPQ
jgi:hypothetical protein